MKPPADHPELPLPLKKPRIVTQDAVAELCALLHGRGWQTAREINRLRPRWNERFIRLLARAARPTIVSSPGSAGYCFHEETTDAELAHSGRTQISQGRDMTRSGIGYLRLLKARQAVRALTEARP